MKKIIAAFLSIAIIASLLVTCLSAAENKIVYHEDFSKVKTFEELGWTRTPAAAANTNDAAKYSITSDKKLLIDNLSGGDSHFVILPTSKMQDIVKDDYTVEYEMTYKDASSTARYFAVGLNFDEATISYTIAVLRMRGQGEFQTRFFTTWNRIEEDADKAPNSLRNTNADSLTTKLYGVAYDANAYIMKDKTVKVRIEVYKDKKVELYVNDILISTTTDDRYSYFKENADIHSALGAHVGIGIVCELNYVTVATGIGIPKAADTTTSAVTTAGPAGTTAPAKVTTAGTGATPDTSDFLLVYTAIVSVMAAAVVVYANKKRSLNS